ncbi:MAG: hypothetical protein KI790_18105 [Cyclobacteriaceae bacterium]|nr:hypothetical protein [Cyclobacteriaceae bacterium HetDA_MAG_MS6]
MRRWMYLVPFTLLIFSACQKNEIADNRESVYLLHQAGYNPIRGEVTFTELEPGKLQVSIELENTEAGHSFPAHLHFGSIREVGELAYRLEEVDGANGRSITILDNVQLSDGQTLTYDLLDEINGSVKIHLDSELFKNMVLAFGNIGKNENYMVNGVTVCTGH